MAELNEDGTVALMHWGYPPRNAKTNGDYCYDCVRVYLKDGKAFDLTINEWKKELAKKGEKGIADHHARVKGVIEQFIEAAKQGKVPKKVKLNWDAVDNYVLLHEERVQEREIAISRRFLTEDEYESDVGKKWDDSSHDRKYSKGIYKGQNGIYARDKLGIALQDEHTKGMVL